MTKNKWGENQRTYYAPIMLQWNDNLDSLIDLNACFRTVGGNWTVWRTSTHTHRRTGKCHIEMAGGHEDSFVRPWQRLSSESEMTAGPRQLNPTCLILFKIEWNCLISSVETEICGEDRQSRYTSVYLEYVNVYHSTHLVSMSPFKVRVKIMWHVVWW